MENAAKQITAGMFEAKWFLYTHKYKQWYTQQMHYNLCCPKMSFTAQKIQQKTSSTLDGMWTALNILINEWMDVDSP